MVTGLVKRLPFFYGWVIIAVAFVTMALGVNARTAFSLLLPPILTETGWDRGVTAGAFSFGFLVSAIMSPVLGRWMDRYGPRFVLLLGIVAIVAGLGLATLGTLPWHLYLTLGVLVGGGSVCMGYSGQSLFLPNWFVQKRGLAMGIAFSGVGVGSMLLLPWMQTLIESGGWRHACLTLAVIVLVVGLPLNLLLRKKPSELGLFPDGIDPNPAPMTDAAGAAGQPKPRTNIVDAEWAAIDWTLSRAMRTARFWWIASGYFCMMYVWYSVQVHQTKYLIDIGFSTHDAAWALGAVSLAGIPGQIALGYLSDRIGREPVYAFSSLGFCGTYLVLLALANHPSMTLLYALILLQGLIGYGSTAVFGAIPAEIFEGKHYGTIFGMLMLGAITGGAVGPWLTGRLFDYSGNYVAAFWIAILCGLYGAFAIWKASPGKVRVVAGRMSTARA